MHHERGETCPSCDEKLKQAHPWLVDWFAKLIKPAFADVHISWSFRGKEDQEKAFDEGKSKLHYPDSAHNKVDADGKPCSRALDLFQLNNGIAMFPFPFYSQIDQFSENNGKYLEWGWNFKDLKDSDHFQVLDNVPQP